ncbi:DUF3800 domain-containing protein [Microbacterium aurum]
MTREKTPIHVFIDESGNLDFGGKGTDHFVLSAFLTTDPAACGRGLMDLRYEFMGRGLGDQIPFHAAYNSVGTRKRVIESMCARGTHQCWVHSIWCDKHLAHRSKHSPEVFYALLGGALAKYMLMSLGGTYSPIVMMFDSTLSSKQRGAFLKAVKPALNQLDVEYRIMFSPVKEDPCGQVADFHAWALFRSLESKDHAWKESLPHVTSEFNIFRYGHTRYW